MHRLNALRFQFDRPRNQPDASLGSRGLLVKIDIASRSPPEGEMGSACSEGVTSLTGLGARHRFGAASSSLRHCLPLFPCWAIVDYQDWAPGLDHARDTRAVRASIRVPKHDSGCGLLVALPGSDPLRHIQIYLSVRTALASERMGISLVNSVPMCEPP